MMKCVKELREVVALEAELIEHGAYSTPEFATCKQRFKILLTELTGFMKRDDGNFMQDREGRNRETG